MSITQPTVPIQLSSSSLPLPSVFQSPLRPDLISHIHSLLYTNTLQAHSVNRNAGMQTAAESWGTGRAVSRIPRVPGGGTHRAGQGAFGNMCRGGRMAFPTKTTRKIHHRLPRKLRRYAAYSALAATAVAALVEARGHVISGLKSCPLVVDSEEMKVVGGKTKKAVELLEKLGLKEELERLKGKRRHRKRGLLVVLGSEEDETKEIKLGMRNIPGVEVCAVRELSVLRLAPGGILGRLVVWSSKGFEELNKLRPLKSVMTNAEIGRVVNSEQVQKSLRTNKTLVQIPSFPEDKVVRMKGKASPPADKKKGNTREQRSAFYKSMLE